MKNIKFGLVIPASINYIISHLELFVTKSQERDLTSEVTDYIKNNCPVTDYKDKIYKLVNTRDKINDLEDKVKVYSGIIDLGISSRSNKVKQRVLEYNCKLIVNEVEKDNKERQQYAKEVSA